MRVLSDAVALEQCHWRGRRRESYQEDHPAQRCEWRRDDSRFLSDGREQTAIGRYVVYQMLPPLSLRSLRMAMAEEARNEGDVQAWVSEEVKMDDPVDSGLGTRA